MTTPPAHRPVTVSTPAVEEGLLVSRMNGTEQLSRLFQMDLDLLLEGGQIALEDVLGQPMTVHLQLPDDETRHISGIVSRFCYTGNSGRYALYQATLRPWLWFLTRSADCRIFQDKTVPDIIMQVFRDHGFSDFEDALTGTYRTWDYCAQYRESAFNFVSRLMEHEGIYYYFRHEEDRHHLVLADSCAAHQSRPGYEQVPFRPFEEGRGRERGTVFRWSIAREVQPGGYALKDFDFERPRADLSVRSSASAGGPHPEFEIYDYPGEYSQSDDGDHYARTRMEELQTQVLQTQGTTDAPGLGAGTLFELIDHPRENQNCEYLIISASFDVQSAPYESGQEGGEEPEYTCSFTVVESRESYRPPRITPKPVVPGPQTAIVVGKSGEEIWTDEIGRVKVQFHWDREGAMDESSSCWIRVSQPWAGRGFGTVAVPRVGQEVIVEFLEGDPDRPIITGRVHNPVQKPPFPLPSRAMVSGTRSSSLEGDGGYNEISLDDTGGEEMITVHARRDMETTVEHDQKAWIHEDRHMVVKRDHCNTVERDRHASVQRDELREISRDYNRKVGGKEAVEVSDSRSITVQGDVIEVFNANHSEQVTGDCYIKARNTVIEATGGLTIKAGGSFITVNASGVAISGPLVMVNSGGAPLSGSPGTAVPPVAPRAAATEEETESSPWHQEPAEEDEEMSWIEIEMVDDQEQPVAGERYRLVLPDGTTVAEGTTGADGVARVAGFEAGSCEITFPDLDGDTWDSL